MNYGILPTEIQLHMTLNDYAFSIGLLGIICGFVFWLGWNFGNRF